MVVAANAFLPCYIYDITVSRGDHPSVFKFPVPLTRHSLSLPLQISNPKGVGWQTYM